MSVALVSEILEWPDHHDALLPVHERYANRMGRLLGQFLRAVLEQDTVRGEVLLEHIWSTPESQLRRILLAPQMTSMLLANSLEDPEPVCDFLEKSLVAEAIRAGRSCEVGHVIWTALGDAMIKPGGEILAAPTIPGLMPLDFDSPGVEKIDLSLNRRKVQLLPLSGASRQLTLDRLASAQRGIAKTSSFSHKLVMDFTKVAVLRADRGERFSAGSNSLYVGCSVVINPHLRTVDEVELADVIVHEGIHSLLYMLEQERSWLIDDLPYDPTPKITSPWSGRNLPLWPFLQACFVWYGLAHFWRLAVARGAFPDARATKKLQRATAGFRGRPLLEELPESDLALLDPGLKGAIARMQRHIEEVVLR